MQFHSSVLELHFFLLDKLDIRDIMDVTKLDIRENKFTDHARHANPLRKEVPAMPREKFKTLTEQMFYILLCLSSNLLLIISSVQNQDPDISFLYTITNISFGQNFFS